MEPLPSIFDSELQTFRPICDDDISRLAQGLADMVCAHSNNLDMAAQITRAINELIWNYVQNTMYQNLNGQRLAN